MGFLHREGGIGGDTSHNALKWVPSMYNSFDHFPNHCLQDVLREIINNAYANFWGVKEVYYGICASSELLLG